MRLAQADIHHSKEKLGDGIFGVVFRCWDFMISLLKRLHSAVGQLTGVLSSGELIEVGGQTVRVGKRVAEGGFAFVHVATAAEDRSRLFALKIITCHEDEATERAVAEMELHSRLPAHANIVPFRAGMQRLKRSSGVQATEVLLLTDFCDGGGLNEALDRLRDQGRTLDEACLMRLFSQACAAVGHLHSQSPPIAHRDVKMENLLLQGSLSEIASGHGRLVLCDFGSATTRSKVYEGRREILDEEERIQKTTTLAYRAPEMVDLYQRKCINEKVDVWALGVLLYVMAYHKFPFDPPSPLAVLSGRYDMPPPPVPGLPAPQTYSSLVVAMIASCLTVDPEHRHSIFEIRNQLGGHEGPGGEGWARFEDMA